MPGMKPRFIYALRDPETDEVRYVGASTAPINRFRDHYASRHQAVSPTGKWVADLAERGFRPGFMIIEEVAGENWGDRECFWIEHYRERGDRLTNQSTGGAGPRALEVGRWSRKYDRCTSCGRDDRRHASNGLCIACFVRDAHRRTEQPERPYYEWSWDYPACVECGTTERPHKGHGLCANCFARRKRQLRAS